MEHIIHEVNEKLYSSSLWDFYFSGARTGILDIETTGLTRERDLFILGGLYLPREERLHLVFAEKPEEEKAALSEYMELVRSCDTVVTYNGRHFDMPFLRARCAKNGVRFGRDPYDLDLYQVLNGHSPLRRLIPNLKQKTVENYMGLWQDRTDEISGADSVEMYWRYVRTGEKSLKEKILLHNSDDVMQLSRLLPAIAKSDFHKAMAHMGFPAGSPSSGMKVQSIRLCRDQLQVRGLQGESALEYRCFSMGDLPLCAVFEKAEKTFAVDVPIVRRSGIAAADVRSAGLDEKPFEKYPGFGSGFLVLQEKNDVKYMEINHFILAVLRRLETGFPECR